MSQKTLMQIVKSVAAELNLPQPTVVLSSQYENVLKLAAFVRSTCDDLLAEANWQILQKRYTLTTTNGVSTYAFPTDIERYINGTFFDQTNRWPWRGPLTPTEWEWLKTTNLSTTPFERFRVIGGQIELYPTPGATPITFVCEYISNSYVKDASTGLGKTDFETDSDICLFDHRVVVYGTKLKFLTSVSQDTTAALADYKRALEFSRGTDTPSGRLSLIHSRRIAPLLSNQNYADGSWSY